MSFQLPDRGYRVKNSVITAAGKMIGTQGPATGNWFLVTDTFNFQGTV